MWGGEGGVQRGKKTDKQINKPHPAVTRRGANKAFTIITLNDGWLLSITAVCILKITNKTQSTCTHQCLNICAGDVNQYSAKWPLEYIKAYDTDVLLAFQYGVLCEDEFRWRWRRKWWRYLIFASLWEPTPLASILLSQLGLECEVFSVCEAFTGSLSFLKLLI